MNTARKLAVRLLKLMMIASLVLPAALYGYASWVSYRDIHDGADERIERSLDVQQEQALKVFETVDRTFAEVDEVVRGLSDDDIRAAQPRLHPRLAQIADVMPQLQAIVLIGRDGRPLASSALESVKTDVNFADRDYFKAQADKDAGTYVSDVRTPNLSSVGRDFFDLSRRLNSPTKSFRGVIAVAVRPKYFEDFYTLIGQTRGSFYALVRNDGAILARYPLRNNRAQRLSPTSALRMAIDHGVTHDMFTVNSEVDGVPRRIGFRKLAGYPVYALAGTSIAAINHEWLMAMGAHLIFGLPATLLLFAVLWFALRRTQRLHDEAERRELAEGALHQAQQLQAIGQLTGGVAHDFNNLLMIVSGSVQRLRRHIKDDKQIHLLDAITTATQRGESLTRQLLTFSRRQTLQPSVIDLAEQLPEIKDMLSRSLRGDIEIRVGVPRRPCTVKVDPSEFELALLNLAVNARDAMPSGGTLSITAKPVVLRGKASEEGLAGDFVAIRVADTGSGIPADVLPRVFEPFFTTKDIGKGHWAGLKPGLRLRPSVRRRGDHRQLGAAWHRRDAVSAANLGNACAAAGAIRRRGHEETRRHRAAGRRQCGSRRGRQSLFRRARLQGQTGGERASRSRSRRGRARHRPGVLRHIDARRHERPRIGGRHPPAVSAHRRALDHGLQFERARRRAPGFRCAAKALRHRRARPRIARGAARGGAETAGGDRLTRPPRARDR